jgi:methionyl-tRNA formyltransferase
LLKVGQAHAHEGEEGQPGATRIIGGLPAVTCGEGTLVLDQLQPAGKRAMEGKVFLSGARGWGTALLGK